jgi:hypothetical protein
LQVYEAASVEPESVPSQGTVVQQTESGILDLTEFLVQSAPSQGADAPSVTPAEPPAEPPVTCLDAQSPAWTPLVAPQSPAWTHTPTEAASPSPACPAEPPAVAPQSPACSTPWGGTPTEVPSDLHLLGSPVSVRTVIGGDSSDPSDSSDPLGCFSPPGV